MYDCFGFYPIVSGSRGQTVNRLISFDWVIALENRLYFVCLINTVLFTLALVRFRIAVEMTPTKMSISKIIEI